MSYWKVIAVAGLLVGMVEGVAYYERQQAREAQQVAEYRHHKERVEATRQRHWMEMTAQERRAKEIVDEYNTQMAKGQGYVEPPRIGHAPSLRTWSMSKRQREAQIVVDAYRDRIRAELKERGPEYRIERKAILEIEPEAFGPNSDLLLKVVKDTAY